MCIDRETVKVSLDGVCFFAHVYQRPEVVATLKLCVVMVYVKGKGLQMTYWLHGKKGFNKPLPTFDK